MEAANALALDQSGPVLLALIAAGFALAVGLVMFAVFGRSSAERQVERRIARVRRRVLPASDPEARIASLRLDRSDSASPILDVLIKRWIPNRQVLRERLEATGLKISVGTYVGTTIALVLAIAGVLYLRTRLPLALDLMLGVLGGMIITHVGVSILAGRRRNAFTTLLPEAIDLIVRGLRSGLPVIESIGAVAREIAEPIKSEFSQIENGVRFGRTLDEMLWETNRRINTAEFKFFVISLGLQRETGGNLAETLENLSDILRRRQAMKLKIKAMSSEARASALIIGSLPFIMTTILFLVSPDYITKLFTDPRGWVLIGIGITMIVMGGGVMAKMVRFEI